MSESSLKEKISSAAMTLAVPLALGLGVFVFLQGSEFLLRQQELVRNVVGICFFLCVVALVFAIIRPLRGLSGTVIFLSSFVFGLAAWLSGLAVTLYYWGWVAVIVGLLFAGIGVVPIGIVAALLHGEGKLALMLFLNVVFAGVARGVGALLLASASKPDRYEIPGSTLE